MTSVWVCVSLKFLSSVPEGRANRSSPRACHKSKQSVYFCPEGASLLLLLLQPIRGCNHIQLMEMLFGWLSVCVRVCVCVDFTKRGVHLPLPDSLDFVDDVVEYHNVSLTCLRLFGGCALCCPWCLTVAPPLFPQGFIVIGANLQPNEELLEATDDQWASYVRGRVLVDKTTNQLPDGGQLFMHECVCWYLVSERTTTQWFIMSASDAKWMVHVHIVLWCIHTTTIKYLTTNWLFTSASCWQFIQDKPGSNGLKNHLRRKEETWGCCCNCCSAFCNYC